MTQQSQIIHSWPTWTKGDRFFHSKFKGGNGKSGIEKVVDRLLDSMEHYPEDHSSGHIGMEVASVQKELLSMNSPAAISFDDLMDGIAAGKLPKWSAMTMPAFGADGVERGAILSEDETRQEIARLGFIETVKNSLRLKKAGLGRGHNIWWPAYDSKLNYGYLSIINPDLARKMLIAWWIITIQMLLDDPEIKQLYDGSFPLFHFEYKPAVPGILDFFPTMKAAIAFCLEINNHFGFKVFVINLEFAHALIGGQTVEAAVKMMIEAGLFWELFHANSSELAIVEWNEDGTEILEGAPSDDKDWAVGRGGQARWDDQQRAIKRLLATGQVLLSEHDIDPSGENPLMVYAESREAIETMAKAA